MKNILGLLVALSVSSAAYAEPKLTCYEMVKAHGLASRTQFQCGFNSYNSKAIESMRECASVLSEQQMMDSLKEGMMVLDDLEKAMGSHKKACAFLQSHYSELVRP